MANRFLDTLFELEERARRPKTNLQKECCEEGCFVQEVYDHCDKHPDASIYEMFRD